VVESGGIIMMMGEYHHSIDEKGRLIIPAKFRYELGDKFIITKGLDGCLFVYPRNEWESIVSKLKALPFTKKDARTFMRFFLSGATECEFDRQGRVGITSPLAEYADLTKDCVVIGVNDRLEIWSKDRFENFFKENEESLSDIAENLFEMESSNA
jgi:MraZ protein